MSEDLNFNDLAEQALSHVGRQCVLDDDGGSILRGEVVAITLVVIINNNGERAAKIANIGEELDGFRCALDDLLDSETGGVQ